MSAGEADECDPAANGDDPPDVLRAHGSRGESAGPVDCPRCGLRLTAPVPSLAVQYCPRCLARSRIAVQLGRSEGRQ
jgi:hypothetical protein